MPGPVHFILRDDNAHDTMPIVPAYGYGVELDDDHSGGFIRIAVREMAYMGEHLQPNQLECFSRIQAAGGGILINRTKEVVGMDHPDRVTIFVWPELRDNGDEAIEE